MGGGTAGLRLRPAVPEDAAACAAVFNDWVDATDWMPRVHPADDVERHYREHVLEVCAVTVAEVDGRVAGFLALDAEGMVGGLYLAPEARGRGVGGAARRGGQGAAAGGADALDLRRQRGGAAVLCPGGVRRGGPDRGGERGRAAGRAAGVEAGMRNGRAAGAGGGGRDPRPLVPAGGGDERGLRPGPGGAGRGGALAAGAGRGDLEPGAAAAAGAASGGGGAVEERRSRWRRPRSGASSIMPG